MAVSFKTLFLVVLVLATLLYVRYESNETKADQRLLKTTMEKPIEHIGRELNFPLTQMFPESNGTKKP